MPRPHTGILPAGPAMFPEKLHFELPTLFQKESDQVKNN
jgi:hypothetical protein